MFITGDKKYPIDASTTRSKFTARIYPPQLMVMRMAVKNKKNNSFLEDIAALKLACQDGLK